VIRRYRSEDAPHLARIFHVAIETIAPAYYAPEQVAAWSGRGANAAQTHARCSDGRHVWVATDAADQPVAFIELETSGHVDMLFCDPVHARRGLASQLYTLLEAEAQRLNLLELTTEASACSRPAFAKWGFSEIRRNDFEQDGVKTFNFIMAKGLQR
jgi:putative acetyltransferase